MNCAHPRLSKLMAARGLCSRREADVFIQRGQVLVDGVAATELGVRVSPAQTIELLPAARRAQKQLATVLLNKPAGYVSGSPEKNYRAAVQLITNANRAAPAESAPSRRGLAPAGRLDIDSRGLLVLTQDGRIARQLVGADARIEKEYLVWVNGDVNADKLKLLQGGLSLDGKPLRPANIAQLKPGMMRFVLTEGRKRQIRRMCEQLELTVVRLVRVRIGRIRLGALAEGKWRLLKSGEQF